MEADVIRQHLDDILKNLFKTMIPRYINGHLIYGGYGVNIVSPAYINLDYGFGFEPNSGNADITHYRSYAIGIPISGWLDTEENLKLFENRVKEDFGRRLIDMCEAINKDDSENLPTNGDIMVDETGRRKPEFHLYLYSFEGAKKDIINANTITECQERAIVGKDIDTYQVMACTTSLFGKGYRVFVHPTPNDSVEIKLGTCECFGGRELRISHNLPRLIACYFGC